jgi:hypothetical protein
MSSYPVSDRQGEKPMQIAEGQLQRECGSENSMQFRTTGTIRPQPRKPEISLKKLIIKHSGY